MRVLIKVMDSLKNTFATVGLSWIIIGGLSLFGFLVYSCSSTSSKDRTLFTLLDSSQSGIDFENTLTNKKGFNIYRYRNFYNGGGVAIGDINNDSLPDIFFTGNQVKNRLYLNKGGFQFVDITKKAGISGMHAWSTGVSMADINGDGLLDIYVCNSGIVKGDNRRNELYINNGDTTFTEQANKYNLADPGYSIHASFFDYDKDGDLDMYLVNNSYRAIGSFDLQNNIRRTRDSLGGDKLFRNELISVKNKNGNYEDSIHFTNISEQAGIFGSEISFGLGVSVGDINRDGWMDMYVSNDFFERDYLYLNNGDGTFKEVLEKSMNSISAASMGADLRDLNGDGYPEIFVAEMLPDDHSRLKNLMTFKDWKKYQTNLLYGYYHQFTRNTLQFNRGLNPYRKKNRKGDQIGAPLVYFSEIGRLARVDATDWSWGALIADYNHDGNRDIFVANGIYKDIINNDYLDNISQEKMVRKIVNGRDVDFNKLINMIPSNPIPNYMFAGTSSIKFADSTQSWGLAQPSFSNGSAYGDLDNDGDLDLVVNNVNMPAFVYRNQITERYPDRGWIQVVLKGKDPNTFAVGAGITVWADGHRKYIEQQPIRGFQSTVDQTIHIGLGKTNVIDSLIVKWGDGNITKRRNIEVNQRVYLSHPNKGDRDGGK